MKKGFPFLWAVFLAGCGASGNPSSEVATKPVTTAIGTSKTKESASQTPTGPLEPSQKAGEPASSDPGYCANRIYQLKDLKTAQIKAAGQTLQVWLMDDDGKRAEGMMFLTDKDVKENQGMIFLFTDIQPKDNEFWMHNCPLGLDIIYIGKNKKVINIGDGPPENDNQVPASAGYDYVLELKRGWSKRHGLKAGDPIEIPDSLKAAS